MLPLFGTVPGGPEMVLVMFFVVLLFFGPVVALVVLAMRTSRDDEEVRELQRRIDELEARVDDGGGRESNLDATGRTDDGRPGDSDGHDAEHSQDRR